MRPTRNVLLLALTALAVVLPSSSLAAAASDERASRANIKSADGKRSARKPSSRRSCPRAKRTNGKSSRRRPVCVSASGRKSTTPTTTITSGPASGSTSASSTASFGFKASQSGSTFECSLDGSAYAGCVSPRTYSGLTDGVHTFKVRAAKNGYTDATPATVSWTIKTAVAPAPTPTPDPTATPTPDPTATPTPTPDPTATPTPTATPVAQPRTTWSAVGSLPLSDAAAAALVTRRPENRPANAAANAYVPTAEEIRVYHMGTNPWGESNLQTNPLAKYVTGRPGLTNPSTDDLIQWTAQKWGIPEDLIRAQMALESGWDQSALGDRTTVSSAWYLQYPAHTRIAGTSDVMQSVGVMQVKWLPNGGVGPGTEPLRWKSVAFNLDYYGAVTRFYYDGHCYWCTTGYAAGQAWNSVGAWFSPYPWNNADTQAYVQKVQTYLADRPWTRVGF